MRKFHLLLLLVASCVVLPSLQASYASDLDEFKVKREEVFEFTSPPQISRSGDQFLITFEVRAFCDVTIAIEDGSGHIVRHLASGVLGENAPEPFEKKSLSQSIVWDGKNDLGRYVDDRSNLHVRVSLGLKPQFERTLYWSAKKRVARGNRPLITASPEGVFVFEGEGLDHLRKFDHQGNYVETVYPFPSSKLDKIKDLQKAVFPQDNKELPIKHGVVQATLLTSGRNTYPNGWSKYEPGATSLAVHQGKIALAMERLNRLSTDGTTGKYSLYGPDTAIKTLSSNDEILVPPRSSAFSPDGRWLYLTGYHFKPKHPRPHAWIPCVMRMDFAGQEPPELFVGSIEFGKAGANKDAFKAPTCVSCDAKGNVYVCDYPNDRIEVYSPEAKLIKSISVKKPTEAYVHPKTGQIYVGSWNILTRFSKPKDVEVPKLTRLGPLAKPNVEATYELPLIQHHTAVFMNKTAGLQFHMAVDGWADKTTIWLIPGTPGSVSKLAMARGKLDSPARETAIQLLVEQENKLVPLQRFGDEVVDSIFRAKPVIHSRQKLYVDPSVGRVYVFEGEAGVSKSAKQLLEIDPATGKVRPFEIPFDAEDLAFDKNGMIYLRTDNIIGRFNPKMGDRYSYKTWQEVPYDYGEERKGVGFSSSGDGRQRSLVGAIVMPSKRPGCFHQGGMDVSVSGNLIVPCYNRTTEIDRREMSDIRAASKIAAGKEYSPKMYPGRVRYNEVHIWDRHGELLFEDAVPGAPMMDGIQIDHQNNIYMMVTPNRILDGKPYFLERAETLLKVAPQKVRIVSSKKSLRIPLADAPDRKPDMARASDGKMWAEGAKWLYGGVGYGGFNSSKGGGGCACWHARFSLDYFGRSFAPEVDHFSVAVLDTAGNLILRVGQYGNVDDGKPIHLEGGPAAPRSIGGDEVALFHAAYVAAHTDHRLFIADGGNSRIVSVKLDYHATKTLPLANIK